MRFVKIAVGTGSACLMSRYSCITASKASNSLKRRERSSDRNLYTACDLDSPRVGAWGFLGSGTMNLPSGARRWFSQSAEQQTFQVHVPSISQNLHSRSSPVAARVWCEMTQESEAV